MAVVNNNHNKPSRRSGSRAFPTSSMAHLSSKAPTGDPVKATSPLEAAAHITQIENGTVLLFESDCLLHIRCPTTFWGKSVRRIGRWGWLRCAGKRDTGKSSLIRELQKIGAGNRAVRDMDLHPEVDGVFKIDYAYVNVRALEDTDSSAELFSNFSIWILQEKCRVDCIRKMIHPSCLKRLMVVICLDLSEPWTMREQLHEWLEFASETLRVLFNELSLEEQEVARNSLEKYLAQYRAQIQLLESKRCDGALEGEPSEEDLEPNLPTSPQLSVNCGVPIVVCVLKSDHAPNLNTRDCPGRADCILAHLRNLCLPYGAGLVYCCSKDAISSRNIDLFYKYCCHRLFDFTFNQQAILDIPEAIFIPSGWDTEEKIRDFVKTTVAGDFETPLESLLPLPDNRVQDTAGVDSIRPQTMTEFLESLVVKDESLLQKDKTVHGSQFYWQTRQDDGVSPNLGGTSTAGGRRRQSVAFNDAAEKYPKSSPRRGVAPGDEDGGRLRTARKEGGDLTSSRGDTESLRLFFQSLLNKKPSTAREARRSEDATSRRSGASKEVTDAPAV